MNYSTSCKYSIRLTEKLKSLDNQNVLDFELINKAIYWARKYHGDQKRKSGEPFYSHPLEVAYMISDYNLKTDVIVTSILHDIVEDTEVTVGMIHGVLFLLYYLYINQYIIAQLLLTNSCLYYRSCNTLKWTSFW